MSHSRLCYRARLKVMFVDIGEAREGQESQEANNTSTSRCVCKHCVSSWCVQLLHVYMSTCYTYVVGRRSSTACPAPLLCVRLPCIATTCSGVLADTVCRRQARGCGLAGK